MDCPTRCETGNGGNNTQIDFEQGLSEDGTEAVADGQWLRAILPHMPWELAMFAQEDLQGYAIMDSGATKSMSGAGMFENVRDSMCAAHDNNLSEIDDNDHTKFTYANDTGGMNVGTRGTPREGSSGLRWYYRTVQCRLDRTTSKPHANVTHDGHLEVADGDEMR